MKHIILTRFNLRKPKRDEWWAERVRLFETYTLPSMMNQSCIDFSWMIFFDTKTCRTSRDQIDQWVTQFPRIKPVFAESDPNATCLLDRRIAIRPVAAASKGHEHVLTTRLDCDDMLHRDAVKFIQGTATNFKGDEARCIDFTRGYYFYLPDQMWGVDDKPWNMFLSLVEPTSESPETCWIENHHKMKRFATTHVTIAPRMWAWVRHDGNFSKAPPRQGMLHGFNADTMRRDWGISICTRSQLC